MEIESGQRDLSTLLEAYIKESKAFSKALDSGESWQSLQDKLVQIHQLGALINKKYEAFYGERRRRHKPPHGD